MRTVRFAAICLTILAMLGAAGCQKSYYFNFTVERDLLRSDGNWIAWNDQYELSAKGLLMNDCFIMAPHFYEGDVEVILRFGLDVEPGSSGADIDFSLYSPTETDSECGITISFRKLGTAEEAYYISHYGDMQADLLVPFSAPIPGLLNGQINVIRIVRKLGRFYFYMNDEPVATNLDATYYTSDLGCLTMLCHQDPMEEQVLIKDVKIIYEGERFLWGDL